MLFWPKMFALLHGELLGLIPGVGLIFVAAVSIYLFSKSNFFSKYRFVGSLSKVLVAAIILSGVFFLFIGLGELWYYIGLK
ncbi:hypothetical protein BH10ACI2_BH10ACI2_15530 [soil metagenome]